MTTLFISDLHLDPARPAVTRLFLEFLAGQARQAEALYILGDLFEAWIGDDDDAPLAAEVADGLRDLHAAGVPPFFVHGNRDFLLGPAFAARTGLTLLPAATVIDLYGARTLIMHGDTLCTDDTEYQAFRRKVRDTAWQTQVLSLPLEQRRARAGQLRETSRQATQLKAEDITDVNADAVRRTMREHGVRCLIHGHTHRPAIHDFELEGAPAQRIVLGDWYEQGSVLVCTPDDLRLEGLALPNRSA